jgi:hypothetical protein
MIKFLLKFIKTEKLWEALLEREIFQPTDSIESTTVWQEVFSRVPFLKDWLRKREMMILKNLAFKDRTPDFIRGQLAENRLYQSFDIPRETISKVEEKQIEELISKDKFLKGWNKNAGNS